MRSTTRWCLNEGSSVQGIPPNTTDYAGSPQFTKHSIYKTRKLPTIFLRIRKVAAGHLPKNKQNYLVRFWSDRVVLYICS